MMKQGIGPAPRQSGKFPGIDENSPVDKDKQGLWHSKIVHVEDILNFDDFVEEEGVEEDYDEKVHCII